ncbi:chemotaxis response regulator protein-glutamate methylesterase [Sporolactobacillus shoreicorticis]|uniref:Protein-glutamate methylesterase/protein-glutamine glutaminase n=1 Tax=Sporolactobacillus shoreicorticis TaxID=1923877 RepID=A0ABW5S8Y2_9BACL|nr:chemotaxis response regulator protein-glutamate methylesterase [Sporolactobacillus shoreicorticis]MCO7125977.1 chemotaxis response regulator protein-glutamate methylesterase [Sporolactobacillus shoreicorticis]
MNPIKVLVVDDSAFMRQTIKAMIEEDSMLQVVAVARDGKDALEKLFRYHPDVITLDIILPGDKDGLGVLNDIMGLQPTPTIMVSGASDENANYVIEAMSRGAFDFIFKPSGKRSDLEHIEHELQAKIRQAAVSKIRVEEPIRTKNELEVSQQNLLINSLNSSPIVLIGTSTGGPKALQSVVPKLSSSLPAPILIVQHMPPRFTKSLAERLNQMSPLSVTEAAEGELLKNGHAYIAPGGLHMLIEEDERMRLKVRLSESPPVNGVRPSIDVTLQSLAALRGYSYVVSILTGMGKDGAKGFTELCATGNYVHAIAESEETCTVFGMPKAMIETGQVNEIQPLYHISEAICSQFGLQGDE